MIISHQVIPVAQQIQVYNFIEQFFVLIFVTLHINIFNSMKKLSLLPFIECKYDDVAFSDCDPIKLTKWREKHLIAGGPSCQKTKNETKGCDASDFPPGNLNNTYFIIFIYFLSNSRF